MNSLLSVLVFSACVLAAQCDWIKEMENKGMWQGDIVLDPDEKVTETKNGSHSVFAAIRGGRWPGGRIPYVITSSITGRGRTVIAEAIAQYHQHTCLRFVPRTNQREYLSFYRGGGCSSPVGWRSGRINSISLATGCWHTGIVMHEIGHSIGFYHEQSRPDRDRYVRIIWGNIQRGMAFNFNKLSSSLIDDQGTAYDYQSMMHYGQTAFGIGGRRTIQTLDSRYQNSIGNRRGFSQIDIKQIGLMYNNICKGNGGSGGGGSGGGGSGCTRDINQSCRSHVSQGYCRGKYAEWMKTNCCKSCAGNNAGGGSSCSRDKVATCSYWASRGYCTNNYRQWMATNCCRTCAARG